MQISYTVLATIGAIVALIGGMMSAIGAHLASAAQARDQRNLLIATQKNAELSEKNASLSEELKNTITGGSSYPKAYFFRNIHDPRLNSYYIYVDVAGEHAIYDLEIVITDITLDDPPKSLSRDEFAAFVSSRDVPLLESAKSRGTFLPRKGTAVAQVLMSEDKPLRKYKIEYFARNGRFKQEVLFRRNRDGDFVTTEFRLDRITSDDTVMLDVYPPPWMADDVHRMIHKID